jgi:hypothetical protein
MDFTAFSHGQITSKLWLCENLEPYLVNYSNTAILGSWYNTLGFMLMNRNNKKFLNITGIDQDPNVKIIADQICNAYLRDFDGPINNITADALTHDLKVFDTVINCSCEHMTDDWFSSVNSKTLVCIQSSDMGIAGRWDVSNPASDIDSLDKRFPLTNVLFQGIKEITYADWSYKRFMIIGYK